MHVSNDKIAVHLSTEFGLVKTAKDVANIISRLESEKLAEEGNVATTDSEKLMLVLDNLPVMEVILFDVLKCTPPNERVLRLVRMKGYSDDEPKYVYFELHEVDKILSSLLECYMDSSKPFPASTSGVLQYLYHFDTSVEGQELKKINSTRTYVSAIVIAWINVIEMMRTRLCPETVINDSTFHLCSGSFKSNFTFGQSPDGRTLTWVKALLSETRESFLFLFEIVIPLIYGTKLTNLITNVQIDGNPHVRAALEVAVESGKFGRAGWTILGSCFFHGVTQQYFSEYASQLAGISAPTYKREGFRSALEKSVPFLKSLHSAAQGCSFILGPPRVG